VATGVVFAVHGAVMGSFAARVPWVAGHVGVGVGGLGVALLMPAVGAVVAMPVSGRLVHRHDLRRLVRVLMLVWCAALLVSRRAGRVGRCGSGGAGHARCPPAFPGHLGGARGD
jgi:predicted MFS family arabinose efflux permease